MSVGKTVLAQVDSNMLKSLPLRFIYSDYKRDLTGNCIFLKLNGKSVGFIGGISSVSPNSGPIKIIATIILFRRNFTWSLVQNLVV